MLPRKGLKISFILGFPGFPPAQESVTGWHKLMMAAVYFLFQFNMVCLGGKRGFCEAEISLSTITVKRPSENQYFGIVFRFYRFQTAFLCA